jgi:regulator of sigma E protease
MSAFLTAVIAVTVVLGIMIFVHEWGHFVAAKLCGVRVEVFSFGFGTRLFGVKRGDTDYRISALPFGGYVRMAGDNPVEERTGASYEFLSRPRWQRVVIAVAGPAMNFLLAFAIFWGIYWLVGAPFDAYLRLPAQVVAMPQKPTLVSGVEAGDMIIAVNGVKTPTWDNVLTAADLVKPGEPLSLTVMRNGAEQTLHVISPDKLKVFELVGYPAIAPVVDEPAIGLPAEKAGMKSGDTIVSMNGKPIATWLQLVEIVRQSEGHSIQLVVRRGGKEFPMEITPIQAMLPDGQTVWQIGLADKSQEAYERQGFFKAAKDAGLETYLNTRQIVEVIGGLFTGKISMRALAGPLGIARMSGQAAKQGPMSFLGLMAVISLNLGLINLLPIPILDGGHVLLLAVEGFMRRDLSLAVKERFVQVGLVFLLAVFAFVMYSDILKLIQSH